VRMIVGALLILAASVCFGSAMIADATVYAQNRVGSPGGLGYIAAFFLVLFGLPILVAGLVTDHKQPSS
jgi:hypothetical protein